MRARTAPGAGISGKKPKTARIKGHYTSRQALEYFIEMVYMEKKAEAFIL